MKDDLSQTTAVLTTRLSKLALLKEGVADILEIVCGMLKAAQTVKTAAAVGELRHGPTWQTTVMHHASTDARLSNDSMF